MTKIAWKLRRYFPSSVDVTTSVMSFSYFQGRQNYLDNYGGGSLTVTLNNQTNVAQYFTFNSYWILAEDDTSSEQTFWAQNVVFNDYPGNTGLSTITVTLVDVLARNGRNVVTDESLVEIDVVNQVGSLFNKFGYQIGDYQGSIGTTVAAATTYTGSMLNYFNLGCATERGFVCLFDDTVFFAAHNSASFRVSGFSFTRNPTSATAISYNAISHNKAGINFMNNVTVSSDSLAPQTAINTNSFFTYGNAQQTVSTINAQTSQALGLAQWLSNVQADPEAERWEVSFQDISQDQTITERFVETVMNQLGTTRRFWDLVYRVPGAGSDTTVQVVIEGVTINATPDKTDFTVYFSPATYYQFFTLDDSIFGILAGDGIVYDQPEIEYDEIGWIYDDANVEQGSRLGW
jgi:hypothetical protein